jgi:hypothetical protein
VSNNFFVFDDVHFQDSLDSGLLDYEDRTIPIDQVGLFTNCRSCDGLHRREYSDRECPRCYEYEQEEEENCLESYSKKFSLPSYGDKLVYGVEIEVEVSNGDRISDAARPIKDKFSDKIMCKSDGSLDHGFEIVTKPYEYEEILSLSSEIVSYADAYGCMANSSCGVHIHANRGALSNHDIAMLLLIFSEYPDDIEAVAGRYSDEWAKIQEKEKEDFSTEDAICESIEIHKKEGRYQAINLQNDATVEFRVFAGTTDPAIMTSYLEFTDKIIKASKKISIDDIGALSFEEILSL